MVSALSSWRMSHTTGIRRPSQEAKGADHACNYRSEELKAKMDRGERFTLLDSRGSTIAARTCPSAINVPYDQVQQRAPAVVPDKNAEIITYCMNPP
jgi:rhodanese-related sulfurtransferase